jgi:hypothetical protein
MNEMVKRVGDALFSQYGTALPDDAAEIARVIFAAMREPTEAMIEVGGRIDNGEGCNVGEDKAAIVWRVMMDAALATAR